MELIETAITRDEIALDMRMDEANKVQYTVLYEAGGIRLYRVTPDQLISSLGGRDIAALPLDFVPVVFRPQQTFALSPDKAMIDLNTLTARCPANSFRRKTNLPQWDEFQPRPPCLILVKAI